MSKYNNKPVLIGIEWFDSKAEAARYQELRLLWLAHEIFGLKTHPRYEIVPKDQHGRALYYEADFEYIEVNPKRVIVEDVKGVKTAVYNLKRRLFLARYPEYTFREV